MWTSDTLICYLFTEPLTSGHPHERERIKISTGHYTHKYAKEHLWLPAVALQSDWSRGNKCRKRHRKWVKWPERSVSLVAGNELFIYYRATQSQPFFPCFIFASFSPARLFSFDYKLYFRVAHSSIHLCLRVSRDGTPVSTGNSPLFCGKEKLPLSLSLSSRAVKRDEEETFHSLHEKRRRTARP